MALPKKQDANELNKLNKDHKGPCISNLVRRDMPPIFKPSEA